MSVSDPTLHRTGRLTPIPPAANETTPTGTSLVWLSTDIEGLARALARKEARGPQAGDLVLPRAERLHEQASHRAHEALAKLHRTGPAPAAGPPPRPHAAADGPRPAAVQIPGSPPPSNADDEGADCAGSSDLAGAPSVGSAALISPIEPSTFAVELTERPT